MKRFTIDGALVKSFDEFVVAMNSGLIEALGRKWNGNLDAFRDYLSWPEEQEYELQLLDATGVAQRLGHGVHAAWLALADVPSVERGRDGITAGTGRGWPRPDALPA